jgi:hypothetical protein
MAYARVVKFDGVSRERMQELHQQIEGGGRPDDVPATEIIALHDPEAGKSLVILFFDSEEDYDAGDAVLSAMSADETPGTRLSVTKYEVATRMTA